VHGPLHVGNLFRPLVNQQHDEDDVRVVLGERVGVVLEDGGLAGAGRRDDERALALPHRRHQVQHPQRQVLVGGLEVEALVGIDRRQVVEEVALDGLLRVQVVYGVHLEEGKVLLVVLGRADLAGYGIALAQTEPADLRRRHVDVVGPGEVVVRRRAEEAVTVGHGLQDALGEYQAVLRRLGLEQLKDKLLLTQAGGTGDAHLARKRRELRRCLFGEFG